MAAAATVRLDDVPAIVASLERDWAITAGQTPSGGTDSYVAMAACIWPRLTRWPGNPVAGVA